MKRSIKKKALIAGSVLAMAGAVTFVAGGQGTAAHPNAARPGSAIRAQHVDLTDPSAPAAQPAPSDSPAVHPGVPDPHHKFLDLSVKNDNTFLSHACVDNSAVGPVCTTDLNNLLPHSPIVQRLDHVTVNVDDDVAKVTASAEGVPDQEIDLSVSLDTVTKHCIFFSADKKIHEDPTCKGF
jgi:hypothetical protein